MRFKKLVTPDNKPYLATSRCVCDLCGKDIEEPTFCGDSNEVTIKALIGDVWPEGDMREMHVADCCLACWSDKVEPALKVLGLTIRVQDADGYPGHTKEPWDPKLYPNGPPEDY